MCNDGSCTGRVCSCNDNYFGLWCENKVYAFGDDDEYSKTITIDPFKSFYFFENYEKGESDTKIEITNEKQNLFVFTMNHRDDRDNRYYTEEYNRKESQIYVFLIWNNKKEIKNFNEESKNLYIQLTNLNLESTEITFRISSTFASFRNQDEHLFYDF